MNKLAINNLSRKFKTDGVMIIKSPDYDSMTEDNCLSDIASKCRCLVISAYTPFSDYSIQYIKLGGSVKLQYKSSL